MNQKQTVIENIVTDHLDRTLPGYHSNGLTFAAGVVVGGGPLVMEYPVSIDDRGSVITGRLRVEIVGVDG